MAGGGPARATEAQRREAEELINPTPSRGFFAGLDVYALVCGRALAPERSARPHLRRNLQ